MIRKEKVRDQELPDLVCDMRETINESSGVLLSMLFSPGDIKQQFKGLG